MALYAIGRGRLNVCVNRGLVAWCSGKACVTRPTGGARCIRNVACRGIGCTESDETIVALRAIGGRKFTDLVTCISNGISAPPRCGPHMESGVAGVGCFYRRNHRVASRRYTEPTHTCVVATTATAGYGGVDLGALGRRSGKACVTGGRGICTDQACRYAAQMASFT